MNGWPALGIPGRMCVAFDIGPELTKVQKAHVARVRLPGELKHGVHHERGRHHGAAGASEEAAQRDDGGHSLGTLQRRVGEVFCG